MNYENAHLFSSPWQPGQVSHWPALSLAEDLLPPVLTAEVLSLFVSDCGTYIVNHLNSTELGNEVKVKYHKVKFLF